MGALSWAIKLMSSLFFSNTELFNFVYLIFSSGHSHGSTSDCNVDTLTQCQQHCIFQIGAAPFSPACLNLQPLCVIERGREGREEKATLKNLQSNPRFYFLLLLSPPPKCKYLCCLQSITVFFSFFFERNILR